MFSEIRISFYSFYPKSLYLLVFVFLTLDSFFFTNGKLNKLKCSVIGSEKLFVYFYVTHILNYMFKHYQ